MDREDGPEQEPDNFFAETEQVAFCPANIVPGIDISNDPLLQGRLFSYLDTQLIRLGGPNFQEIPINRPLAPVANNQREGYNRMTINRGETSYVPNSLGENKPRPASVKEGGFAHYQEKIEGKKIRARSEKFNDHFSQAKLFWNSISDPEKEHIVKAFHFELGKVSDEGVRKRVVDLINNVDGDLAIRIAEGIGVPPPAEKGASSGTKKSPNLSQEMTVKDTIKSRKVAILAMEGYNHDEVMLVKQALKDSGAHPQIISQFLGMVKSTDGREMEVDKSYITTTSVVYDAVYIPGGKHAETLKNQGYALHFVNEAFKHCKPIGAVGEGIELLKASDIKGVTFADAGTGGEAVTEMGVVTCGSQGNVNSFAEQFKTAIAQHRHWDREKKEQVPA
mgnify:CR=1 FL=1